MELDGYRTFKQDFVDNGKEVLEILDGGTFNPDFANRNTMQIWDISSAADVVIGRWIGTTLTERTLHEISIVNNSAATKKVAFTSSFLLTDEEFIDDFSITIGPRGTAYFYCTGVQESGNLIFTMRTGSQDNRNN